MVPAVRPAPAGQSTAYPRLVASNRVVVWWTHARQCEFCNYSIDVNPINPPLQRLRDQPASARRRSSSVMNVVESLQKRSTGELSPRQHCRWNDVTARHVKSLRMRAVLTGHTGCVNRMAWNESGTQLVTGIAILKMGFLCNATARSRSGAVPWRSGEGS